MSKKAVITSKHIRELIKEYIEESKTWTTEKYIQVNMEIDHKYGPIGGPERVVFYVLEKLADKVDNDLQV